jgi:tRNA uridine 5-carbamoylmethylation protein Kti12
MTTLHMMVGLPASGKSTWRDAQAKIYGGIVASSDDYIEAQAKEQGKTYNEVFKESIKGAETHVKSLVTYAVQYNKPLIWDQTNLNVKTRQKKLLTVPYNWKKIAVVVRCRDFDEWKHRLMSRPGKTIPVEIVQSMMKSFEMPTLEEGFSEIIEVWT